MGRSVPRAGRVATGAWLLAPALILAGCTLSFDAVGDGGRREGGRSDARIDATLPEGGGMDAPSEGGQPPTPPPEGGVDLGTPEGGVDLGPPPGDGATCNPTLCPRVQCAAPICQPDGRCGQMLSPAGTSCDDGDPCTAASSCNGAGACVGSGACADDGDECTAVECTARGCETSAVRDGIGCSAGRCCGGVCRDTDTDLDHCGGCGASCDTGLCIGGACASCSDDSDCPTTGIDVCVASGDCIDGRCEYEVRSTHCFIDGSCFANGEIDTRNPCHFCTGGATTWSERSICDDGQFCTVSDVCVSTGTFGRCDPGAARNCDDGNPCTADSCNEMTDECGHTPTDGATCDDRNPCTTTDRCMGSTCTGTGSPCPAPGPCERSLCDGMTGACSIEFISAGTTCDDGDPCTTGETCVQQMPPSPVTACIGGPTCVDTDCETASCNSMTGACSFTPKPPGEPCSDMSGCFFCDGASNCIFVCSPI